MDDGAEGQPRKRAAAPPRPSAGARPAEEAKPAGWARPAEEATPAEGPTHPVAGVGEPNRGADLLTIALLVFFISLMVLVAALLLLPSIY